ncbi:YesL family protein [Paenibacillus sp. GCM10027627]|uniref:YesL family protein n=1 Tax=unclassified Paenibacillus TaxID=185978 RepID=UPI00362A9BDF
MEPKGLMGGFYRISEWIMRLAVINLLWIICSFPFIAFLFMTLIAYLPSITQEQIDQHGVLRFLVEPVLIFAVLAPLTLFPATAAMFTVARKWVTGEVDVPLFKTFFRGYKENYKQSLLGGIVYTLLFILMFIDFIAYREQLGAIAYIFLALLALLGASVFNYFSMLVHYHMKTFQLIKNAVLITIGKPIRSITTALMCGLVIYFSFAHFTFLLPFFTGSVVAFVAYWNFNIIYTKLQEQAEKIRKSEEQAAEEAAELDREDLVKNDNKLSNK